MSGGRLQRVLPDWAVAVSRYVRVHHVVPNLIRPKTFNEKVLHRILFGRQPWMAMVADKYRVRDYVRDQLGASILPELHHVTTDPDTIPFELLPDRFVAKPTHGSGWVEIVHDKTQLDPAKLRQTCRSWLGQNYYEQTREWIYKDIRPRILIEEFIDDGSVNAPNDYKLFVFGGRVAFILVTMDRFDVRAHVLMDRDWNQADVTMAYSRYRRPAPPPPHLAQMIAAAETLAHGMDFVRADFYDTRDKLFFGELTATPGCGLDRFEPLSFDAHLGALWKLGDPVKPRSRSSWNRPNPTPVCTDR